jgi:choline kinase
VSTYLNHQPGAAGTISPLATPTIRARASAAFAPLDLDAGADEPSEASQLEQSADDEHDKKVRFLMQQTRLWRVMGSAQWIAWGIVQAKVPGMEEAIAEEIAAHNGSSEDGHNGEGGQKTPVEEEADEEGDFDYLAYSQDRAMFFWSDLLALNLVRAEDLPAPLVEHIKSRLVEY